jgi:hydrogenase maturation protein HypF
LSDKTFKIQIKGRVQGVGFRPFVFNLAQQLNINGTVSNNEDGVVIKITTTIKKATFFLETLQKKPPTISIITASKLEETKSENFLNFCIVPSSANQNINIPLTPDFATCKECKEEIIDVENRRYGYPFTTCVNCGPRYAITTKFPFERAHTTLSNFEMCLICEKEYTDPTNRRFHSQTNSCSDCGIQLELVDNDSNVVTVDQQNILKKTATYISEGKIIAIKNTNGYLLCCDATNSEAVEQLRQKKKRPNKPFAILYNTIDDVQEDFKITAQEKESLTSTVAPIVILENTQSTRIATQTIAPNLHKTGVLLPSSALLLLLMSIIKKPIVCTSGNIHGSPIISENDIAQEKLAEVADYFIHHNLPIQFPQDDSVVKVVDKKQVIIRRSRGFAPNYLTKDNNVKSEVLAMGAHLKSTFSLVPNTHIYVSQYFGNLDSYDVLERYQKTIKQQLNIFNCSPETVLIDAHPAYQSSIIGKELAKNYNAEIVKIQHHKAHFASVLGECQLFDSDERILGVVWDGTGYGDDNAIWGGEFFIYEKHTIERISHFEYYDWLANNKMAQEPRVALLSLLDNENKHYIKDKFSNTEWKVYSKMLENNVLKTSSVGRLFDAVASALNIKDINTFEAEAPMLLENCALTYSKSHYINFLHNVDYDIVPSKLIVKKIIKAYRSGFCKERLAYSFIYTLAKCIINITQKNSIDIIACSGGVFQNSLLLDMLAKLTKNYKIKLKLNRKLSANDENISFGQLMYFQNIKN